MAVSRADGRIPQSDRAVGQVCPGCILADLFEGRDAAAGFDSMPAD